MLKLIVNVGTVLSFFQWNKYFCLEKFGSPLKFISPPLWEAVEVHTGHVEHHFKVSVWEVTLQVTAIHIVGQAIITDKKEMGRIDLGRLRRHMVHVGQWATQVWGVWGVATQTTTVCGGCTQLCVRLSGHYWTQCSVSSLLGRRNCSHPSFQQSHHYVQPLAEWRTSVRNQV